MEDAVGWVVFAVGDALMLVGTIGLVRAVAARRCERGLHSRYWAEPGRWRCRRCGTPL
jgi:hypothetical protein